MKVWTMSLVVGTRACNAKCPFCVARMTGFDELPKAREINRRNLRKAIQRAKLGGVTTVLLTGKGEPTLYPQQIEDFLGEVGTEFPAIEMQTNGLEIGRLAAGQKTRLSRDDLVRWHELGLDTVALSVVSIHPEHNRKVYHSDYPDLATTVAYLRGIGFTIRLCVMMQKGCVDTPEAVFEVADWCRTNHVTQLTVRPIRKTDLPGDPGAAQHVTEFGLDLDQITEIRDAVQRRGTLLLNLMHGAEVYDVNGQNLCVSDCLTRSPDPEDMRQLIFFANGRLVYDWQYHGAVLLDGWDE